LGKINKHIAQFLNEEVKAPSVIIDENFEVVSYNKSAEGFFNEIYAGKKLDRLQNENFSPEIFRNSKRILSGGVIQIFVCKHLEFIEKTYRVIVTRFDDGNERYFQIVILPPETENDILVFISKNFPDYPVSQEIKNLINGSISEYPFTLVGENEFKRMIDGYPLPFWIKGPDNEIKIGNLKFRQQFAVLGNEMLKRDEAEILPIKLSLFFSKTAQLVSQTGIPVFIIRHNLTSGSDTNQQFWLLQYPILGKENKVLGIISAECEILDEETEIDCKNLPERSAEISFTNEENYSLTGNMLEHLIKILPEPVYVYDSETLKILEANEKVAELYGYEPEELKQLTVADLYSPENVQILLEVAKADFNAKDKIGPVKHQKKDGTLFDVEILNSDIVFNGKKAQVNVLQPVITGTVAETESVTATGKTEKEIFNDLDELIIITDKNGFITYVNESVVNKLGYEKKYLDNRPFFSLIDKENWEWLSDIFSEAESRRERFSFETNIKLADGDLKEARLNGIPLYRSDEEYYAFIVKINESGKLTAEKPETEAGTANKGAALDFEFLSELFHEILTPVNVILGFTHEIIEGLENPTEEQRESAEIIWENQKILLQIMDAASQYALLESGKLKLDLKNVSLRKTLEDVAHNLAQFLEENNVKFIVQESEGELQTDVKRLGMILSAVIKLAAAVSTTGNLFAGSKSVNGKIIVTFSDFEGTASNEFLEKLKAVFISNEFTGVQNYGISGIVIKLVKKLARLFNAGFEIITENGSPVKFAITLPAKLESKPTFEEKPAEEEPETAETKTEEAEKIETEVTGSEKELDAASEEEPAESKKEIVLEPKDTPEIKIENLSCFYFEDQLDTRLLFSKQMQDLKKIDFAASLEEALPKLINEHYDFILMDIRLEGDFDGIAALKIIKSLPGYKDTPVIAVTAYTENGDREKYLKLGFNEYIPKPFLREEVIEALRKIF